MKDKEFHALCAAHAMQALIQKHQPKGLTTRDDPLFAHIAMGAITYADRMVEFRKLRRKPYKSLFAWMSNWTTWIYAMEESIKQQDGDSHD